MTAPVDRSMRHLRSHPCPICKGFDEAPRGGSVRCHGFTNGEWCRCSNDEYRGALDADGQGLYRHLLRGECRCGQSHGPAVSRHTEPEAIYDYRDERGMLLFQVLRLPGKQFRQRRPDASKPGGWDWKTAGMRLVLYRLPELLASTGTVHIVEGEKDVETLRAQGLVATCNPMGAGKWSKVADHARQVLDGRSVLVIADADEPGRRHACQVTASLGATALEPTKGKDITEHLANGGTLADLVALPAAVPPVRLVPPPPPSDEPPWGDGEPPGPDEDDRPVVHMGKDIHRIIAELDKALGTTDPLLFQRDNELVAISGSKPKEGKARLLAGTPIIRQLKAPSLLPRLTEHVKCATTVRPSAKAVKLAIVSNSEEPRPELSEVLPSPLILNSFLGALDWVHVRPIAGITECPTLRPDGTVMQDAGYDPQTGYLYLPTCDFPRVADEPTHSDAVLAYARLAEVFCDFPYVDASHRAAVVASILALVARPAIQGPVPCMLFDASSRRSGKTLQVDVISLIVSGRPASRMTYPENDEELEKVLAGYALVGARMINFDNIERPFGGPPLDKCITAEDTVDLRVLGSITLRTLTWRAIIFGSGNNVRGRGDMLERVLAPRVESPLEHPEKRDLTKLRHPKLRPWVAEHRTELVHHALTILRAFCAAGRPRQPVDPWGGFEAFTDLVAHALVWTGAPDPLGARRGGDGDEDPTRRAERVFVEGWRALCASQSLESMTMSAALRVLYPPPKKDEPPDGHDDLREAIAELAKSPGGLAPDTRRMGDVLRRLKRKLFDGARLEPDGTTGGTARWRVVRAP